MGRKRKDTSGGMIGAPGVTSDANLRRTARKLFQSTDDAEAFIAAVKAGQSGRSAAINLGNSALGEKHCLPPAPFQPPFTARLTEDFQAGASDEHKDGRIYALDLSSIFEASVLLGIDRKINRLIDVCAAPGGKTVFAYQLFRPELLIANESVGKRVPPLLSNLKRCRIPALISSADPKQIAEVWEACFELAIVDAPCSGQSLLARGEDNPGCFHPVTVNANSSRQKRIIACSASLVAKGGFLAYMTCTYSPEENEQVVEWLVRRFPEFEPVEVPLLDSLRSRQSDIFCYRLFPDQGCGAGGFCALLRRTAGPELRKPSLSALKLLEVRSAV